MASRWPRRRALTLRVVLYAEGSRETGGEPWFAPTPGVPLTDDELGPAHLLMRRAIAARRGIPEPAVRFEGPLRTSRGTVARGTQLYDTTSLRRLLTWPAAERRPHLAIALVDADGDSHRRADLLRALEGIVVPHVVAVATQEFESWLIADHEAVRAVFGRGTGDLPDIESMRPREAKDVFTRLVGEGSDEMQARRTLASMSTLAIVAGKCRSFEFLLKDLDE